MIITAMSSGAAAARPRLKRACARALVAASVATLSLGLASCGFVNTGSPDEDSGGGTLTLTLSTEQNAGLKELLPEFEKESGAKVKVNFGSVQDLNEQIRIKLNAGTADDIFKVSPGASSPVAAQVLADSGDLQPLEGEWKSSLSDSSKSLSEFEGKQLAFPLGQNALVMAYNKDVFASSDAEVPSTWPELLDASAKIKKDGTTPIAAGFTGGITLQFWIYALASSMVYADNPDIDSAMGAGETSFGESSEWQQVFKQFKALQDKGYFTDGSLGTPPEEATKAVAKGSAGMTLVAASSVASIQEQAGDEEKIGIFVVPGTNDADQTRIPVAPDLIGVNASSDQLELSQQLFSFLARKENVTTFAQSAGMLPGLTVEGAEGDENLDSLLPYLESNQSVAYANYLWPNGDTQQTLLQSGQDYLIGKITLDELTARLDAEYAKGTG